MPAGQACEFNRLQQVGRGPFFRYRRAIDLDPFHRCTPLENQPYVFTADRRTRKRKMIVESVDRKPNFAAKRLNIFPAGKLLSRHEEEALHGRRARSVMAIIRHVTVGVVVGARSVGGHDEIG